MYVLPTYYKKQTHVTFIITTHKYKNITLF
jgi:hypothetical protein